VVVHTCNQEAEAGRSQIQGQPSLHTETVSQKKKKKTRRGRRGGEEQEEGKRKGGRKASKQARIALINKHSI
jgi:hypothetical protein